MNGMSATAFLLREDEQNESYCLEILSGAQLYDSLKEKFCF